MRTYQFLAGLLLTLCSVSPAAFAKVQWLVEMGANQGFLSAGIASDYGPVSWAATYGLTPSARSNVIITQLNLKAAKSFYHGQDIRLFLGPALLINGSKETFFIVPEKYPDGYYPPNAYFFALQGALVANNGYFFELSILDYYFEVLARNPRGSVSNLGLLSLGFGKAI